VNSCQLTRLPTPESGFALIHSLLALCSSTLVLPRPCELAHSELTLGVMSRQRGSLLWETCGLWAPPSLHYTTGLTLYLDCMTGTPNGNCFVRLAPPCLVVRATPWRSVTKHVLSCPGTGGVSFADCMRTLLQLSSCTAYPSLRSRGPFRSAFTNGKPTSPRTYTVFSDPFLSPSGDLVTSP
jgi:hypothetical protein